MPLSDEDKIIRKMILQCEKKYQQDGAHVVELNGPTMRFGFTPPMLRGIAEGLKVLGLKMRVTQHEEEDITKLHVFRQVDYDAWVAAGRPEAGVIPPRSQLQ